MPTVGMRNSNYPAHYSLIISGTWKTLGGYNGGLKNSSNGYGPGAGKLKGGGVSGNLVGGGAGYGSIGQYHCKRQYLWHYLWRFCPRPPAWWFGCWSRRNCRRRSRWRCHLSGSGRKWYPYHPVRSHHLRQWGRRCQYKCKWRWWRIRWVYSSCRKIDH